MTEPSPAVISRLVGVYDAEGTLRGELAYWVGARLGRAHCALCDITHGALRRRPDWVECRDGLPVGFDTYHRNDQPDAARRAARGDAPVVLAEMADATYVVLLDAEALRRCEASPPRLVEAIGAAADRLHLAWV